MFQDFKNVTSTRVEQVSAFRKLSIGTWRDAYDPSVYGFLNVDARPIDAWLKHLSEVHAVKLTYTHFITRALAEYFKNDPDANCYLRFQRPRRRTHVTALVQVAIASDDHHRVDLSGVTLRRLEEKSIVDIAVEIRNRADKIRKGQDADFSKVKGALSRVPFWLMFPFIQIAGFVSYTLNIKLKAFGLSEDPFGTFMVTNIGSFGLEVGLAPLVPYSRCGLVVTLGATSLEAVVNAEGKIEVAPVLHMTGTFDHRLFDGFHTAKLVKFIKAACADPQSVLGDR